MVAFTAVACPLHDDFMTRAILEHYRCPEMRVTLALAGELSSEPGYFSFGPETVCFGRSSGRSLAPTPGNRLRDLSRDVTSDGPTLRLPFDLSEIVDNLRRERYAARGYAGSRSILSSEAIRRIYYRFRPLLGISVRKHLQKLFLRDWVKLPFPRWPVDTTVEQILERVLLLAMKAQGIESMPFIWFWPEGASSCLMVTHDVETEAGVHFIPRLMEIDEGFGVKSSFQLIPQKQYLLEEGLLKTIAARGFEVCIQDLEHVGNLFDDRDRFLLRAGSINQYLEKYQIQGFRAGRLYRNADWYEALNISYDMSIPNVAHLEAQRGGCCTVFPFFIDEILELPVTTVEDYSLFHILVSYSIDLWKNQIALIMEKHGLVSFIVHPDYIIDERALDVYKALLGHVSRLREQQHVWVALPRDVNRWWRERGEARLVADGGGHWRIEGPAQDRARIACASIRDDRLLYTMGNRGNV